MKSKEQLGGIYSASITAYDAAGAIDAGALQAVMERNLAEGAAGFFVGGSSGECFLLTEAERIQVFEAAAALRGRTNLIAHVGAIGTGEAVRYAKAAMALGFDFCAATAPFSHRRRSRVFTVEGSQPRCSTSCRRMGAMGKGPSACHSTSITSSSAPDIFAASSFMV